MTVARHLPAAVIDPRIHDAATVAAAARIVPDDARRISVEGAQLGYVSRPRRGGFGFAARRLHEIERIIQLRHGGPVDTDDAESYFALAIHCIVPRELQRSAGRPDPVGLVIAGVTAWCARWLPGLGRYEIAMAIEGAMAEPKFFRADTAAKILRLTMKERAAADVRTIGAVDADAEERALLRRARHAERARERRAEERAATSPRGESVAAACRRLGISRATFYRRKAAEKEARDSHRAQHEEEESHVAHAKCLAGHGGAQRRAATNDLTPTPEPEMMNAKRTFPPRTRPLAPTAAARRVVNQHLVRSGHAALPDALSDYEFAAALDRLGVATVAALGRGWQMIATKFNGALPAGGYLEKMMCGRFIRGIALELKQRDSDARNAKRAPPVVFPPPVTGTDHNRQQGADLCFGGDE